MAALTPREARRIVDGAPVLDRHKEAEVAAAEAQASAQETAFLTEQVAEIDTVLRTAQQAAAVEVRDVLETLVRDGLTEAVSFQQYAQRFTELDEQVNSLEAEATELGRRIAYLEEIEANPGNFSDSLYRRFPQLRRPDFSF